MGPPGGPTDCAVIGIGELLWDLLPAGPRLGGAPFNCVAQLRRFGCRAAYVSAVGADRYGRQALSEVARLGVDASLIEVGNLPTGVSRVWLDKRGNADYEIVSPAAYEMITHRTEFSSAVGGGEYLLVFGTLAQRFASVRAATQLLASEADDADRLYDVNLRHDRWDPMLVEDLLGLATVVKMNDEEQGIVARELRLPGSSTERFARAVSERFNLRGVCVTRGAAGAALLLDDAYAEAESPSVQVVDTVGAGDAFAAALGKGLLEGWTVAEILAVATRLGALVASRAGATPDWSLSELGLATVPRPGVHE